MIIKLLKVVTPQREIKNIDTQIEKIKIKSTSIQLETDLKIHAHVTNIWLFNLTTMPH